MVCNKWRHACCAALLAPLAICSGELPRLANIPEFTELDGSAEFLELCKKAAPQIVTPNELAGKNGKPLCHGNARPANCPWPNQRKDPLVLIDWQFVSYAHMCSDLC